MIRAAGWDDIPQLISYISDFHQASPWSGEEFSPAATRTELQTLISGDNGCVFIHDNGAIGGHIAPLRFGKAMMAQELFWWAERDGFSLLKAFEDWAKSKNVSLTCVASLASPRLRKIYERRGYTLRETFFVKSL